MLAAVEDVHHRHRHGILATAVQLGDVLVQGHLARLRGGLGRGQGNRENGVGAKAGLVLGTIGIDHRLIQFTLLCGVASLQQIANRTVDVGHRLEHTLAQIPGTVAIAQLQGFPGAGGGAGGGAGRADFATGQGDLGQHGRVAAGIHDLEGLNVCNTAHAIQLQ